MSAAAAEPGAKFIFVTDDCSAPLGSEVVASFKQEVLASPHYRLAKDMMDDGGYRAVITIRITCSEKASPASERTVAVASIIGFGACNTSVNCTNSLEFPTLRASLCGGAEVAKCGKDLFISLDTYMNGDGLYSFRLVSEARKKAAGESVQTESPQ
jgi:hypothetical protein